VCSWLLPVEPDLVGAAAQECAVPRPFASHNEDGRLEVFAAGVSGIFNIWQGGPNGGWADG
jgi:hypothetical protein